MKNPAWSTDDSADLYGIREWGHSYFDISRQGEVVVNLKDGSKKKPVSLSSIVRGLRERGTQLPLLIRFGDLLRWRIDELNEGFVAMWASHARTNRCARCSRRSTTAATANTPSTSLTVWLHT